MPSPSELGRTPRACAELLAELLGIDALRQPLIRELAALLQRRGGDERELLQLARGLWRSQVHAPAEAAISGASDVPVRRKPARARAVEIATG